MKKQLQPNKNINDDLLFWIKEYLASKVLTISIDKDCKDFNRKDMAMRITMSTDFSLLKEYSLIVRGLGMKNLRSYTIPLFWLYEFIDGRKDIEQLKEFDTTLRDKMFLENSKGYKKKTLEAYLNQVNSLFKFITENNADDYAFQLGRTRGGRKTESPIKQIEDEDNGVSHLKKNDIRHFLKQMEKYPFKVENGSKPKLMMKIALFAGLRADELASIKRDEVSVASNPTALLKGNFYKIYIDGKSNKQRLVYIDEKLIKKEFDAYIKDADLCAKGLLFCTENHTKYTNVAIYQMTKRLLDFANIDIKGGIHAFRRSYATLLAVNNFDLAVISELLGHSSQEVTELYIFLGKEDLRDVVKYWNVF